MKEILKQISDSSLFQLSIFDDSLQIKGRVLSPAEVEAAGLASAMVARDLLPQKGGASAFVNLHERIDGREFKDLDDGLISDLLSAMNTVKPETLLKMQHQQDMLLTQIVQHASSDGVTWERLILVNAVEQQDPDAGRLWVGMIPKEDRDRILECAMKGHQEASQRLATFRQR